MKVTIGKTKDTEVKFPCLMISNAGIVILCSGTSNYKNNLKGVALKVKGTEYYNIGYYSEAWAENEFTKLEEPITLEND